MFNLNFHFQISSYTKGSVFGYSEIIKDSPRIYNCTCITTKGTLLFANSKVPSNSLKPKLLLRILSEEKLYMEKILLAIKYQDQFHRSRILKLDQKRYSSNDKPLFRSKSDKKLPSAKCGISSTGKQR